MNYYIIPKNTINIKINLQYRNIESLPFISNSVNLFVNKKINQINNLNLNSTEYINIKNLINYLNIVYNQLLNFINKLHIYNQTYYELLETITICNIKEYLCSKQILTSAHISPNYIFSNNLFTSFRTTNKTDIFYSSLFNYQLISNLFLSNTIRHKIDLFFIEFNNNDYSDIKYLSKNILITLYLLCKYQSENGNLIIKLENFYSKIVVDFLYILSTLYEKIIIIKPIISNITDSTKYVVCKGFINSNNINKIIINIEDIVINYLTNYNQNNIYIDSILENTIPYYFLNKIEEINIVIGQQQIDSLEQIISLVKNKNKDEKIETIKKSNVQKGVQWCEKFNIPYNKLFDKTNIFLKKEVVFDNC
jgi:hypothetical protein